MNDKNVKLNKEQKDAVENTDGPVLIVAGAGTGKTSVLIEKLSFLLKNKLATVDEILLITFTEKAAAEMEERADQILPYGYVDLWINTFHGFCQRILREHALDIGLPGDFKLITQTEQWILIKKNIEELGLDYYRPLGNPNKFIHEIIKHFSRLKDENISAKEYLGYVANFKKEIDKNDEDAQMELKRLEELATAFEKYNKILLNNSLLDFGDLIMYTIRLFQQRSNILSFYAEKFKYIMVDEFQDTNWAQYELVKMLSRKHKNLMVVGDDDQSVYKFRGASISNIMQFKDDYPKAREVILVENYRSGQNILDKSYEFIKHNDPNRLETKLKISKELKSNTKSNGLVKHLHYPSDIDEVKGVVAEIKKIYSETQNDWSDFAILVRANDTALKFISILSREGIPNHFVSLRGLYYKPIIMDVIAYFKLLDNYHESSALHRVLTTGIVDIDFHDLIEINKMARRKVWSSFEALRNIDKIAGLKKETYNKTKKLLGLIDSHSKLAKSKSASHIFLEYVRGFGLINFYDFDQDQEQFEYLNQLYRKMKDLEVGDSLFKVRDFIEAINLELESGESGAIRQNFDDVDKVNVMTVHASKGLEFKYVFLVNLVDKKFPTINRREKISIPDAMVKESLPEGDVHIEEERRLFYVALTRAKEALYLTSASDYGGAQNKKVSKFLNELGFEVKMENKKINREIRKTDLWEDLFAKKISENEKKEKHILPKRFSFSQIAAYTICPYQYRFNFILKIPVEDKPSFVFGRVMHNALRDIFLPLANPVLKQVEMFSSKGENVRPGRKEIIRIFENNWRDDGYRSKKERDTYKEKGLNILLTLWNDLEDDTWPAVVFVEKNFNIKIGGQILKGAIDRVDRLPDGTYEIIDYKTGKAKEKLTFEDKRQLLLYKIAAEEVFGLKVSKLSFYYLENNSILSFKAKESEIEKLDLLILDTIAEIKKSKFPPKPGMVCSWCDFSGICDFRKS